MSSTRFYQLRLLIITNSRNEVDIGRKPWEDIGTEPRSRKESNLKSIVKTVKVAKKKKV
ncbi:MAG: hypothetical protein M5F18_13660 [Asgard group archaeon]|nr:hypothetical protein [Asgard group archaeon]